MQKKSKPRTGSVVIVGAGISGLAAAQECLQRGFETVILEGRTRPGGRIWTDTSLDTPVDLGAAWIHGKTGNPIYKICRLHEIETLATDYSKSCLLKENGERAGFLSKLAFSTRANRVLPRLRRLRKSLEHDISLAAAVEMLLQNTSMSEEELLFLNRQLIEFQAYNASSLEEQSLFYLLDSAEARHGEDRLFPQGYSQVIDNLAVGLSIKFEETVIRVKQDEIAVSVETNKGVYSADAAIITLPLGVLKSGAVAFEPELPQAKQSAISELRMGLFNKIAMRFEKPFWDLDSDLIELMPRQARPVYQFLSLYRYANQAVLVALVAADTAEELEAESDQIIVSKTMELLRSLYGDKIANPIGVSITRWGQDKFSLGSYSVVRLGNNKSHFDAIAEPFGRLYFAGEASTYSGQGTVHGAYHSGIRAARELNQGWARHGLAPTYNCCT